MTMTNLVNAGRCSRCNEDRLNPENCLCVPFKVWLDDDPENEAETVFGSDGDIDSVAEKFAQESDSGRGEYNIIQSGGATLRIRDSYKRHFVVQIEAYSEPVYNAHSMELVEEIGAEDE